MSLMSSGIATGLMSFEDGGRGYWNRIPWFSLMNADIERLLKTHLTP